MVTSVDVGTSGRDLSVKMGFSPPKASQKNLASPLLVKKFEVTSGSCFVRLGGTGDEVLLKAGIVDPAPSSPAEDGEAKESFVVYPPPAPDAAVPALDMSVSALDFDKVFSLLFPGSPSSKEEFRLDCSVGGVLTLKGLGELAVWKQITLTVPSLHDMMVALNARNSDLPPELSDQQPLQQFLKGVRANPAAAHPDETAAKSVGLEGDIPIPQEVGFLPEGLERFTVSIPETHFELSSTGGFYHHPF